jgi:hypothetical protein
LNFQFLRILAVLTLMASSDLKAITVGGLGGPLDFIVYETGGQKRFARRGDRISIYWGDVLKFHEMGQPQASQGLIRIKTMGAPIMGGKQKNLSLTDGLIFDSGLLFEHLSRRTGWFQKDKSETFSSYPDVYPVELVIQSGKNILAQVPVQLVFPQLSYLEVTINQTQQLIRNGQSLSVKESDRFKVNAIATNPYMHSDVFYQVVKDKDKVFLQLVRKKMLFATVMLDIER